MTGGIADQTRWLDAVAQAQLVASGELSASELLEAAIERIEALDATVNAVIMRWFDHARGIAARESITGVFAGVPFLLKDWLAHYAGQRLSNGNTALRDAAVVSTAETTLVSRFRAAGLVVAGRTNTPEFAGRATTDPRAWGATRNPWNTAYSVGGSSGGAAAAVAAGMVPIAHATDGAGSIRIPASCCGVVGLKPSQGRITAGPFADDRSPGVEFAISRSIRDTAALLDAVAGPGVGDSTTAPAPRRPYRSELDTPVQYLRIGLLDHDPQGGPVNERCVRAVHTTALQLEALGHHVEPAFPAALADPAHGDLARVLGSTAMNRNLARLAETLGREISPEDVEPESWQRARAADHVSATEYAAALETSSRIRRAMHQWWADGFDLLLTPTMPHPPARLGEPASIATTRFTRAFNLTGQPAISLPLSWTDDGLPIGIQLVGAHGREDLLIRTAAHLEHAHPWVTTFTDTTSFEDRRNASRDRP